MHCLVISPHLDDGAFSVPEPMAALREAGWRATLATVFTRSVAAPSRFALACQLDKGLSAEVDYMALRRDEDIAFCRALDLDYRHLDLAEAPHRGYDDVSALFGEVHAADPARAEVAAALADLIAREAPDVCLSPIGIGGHVDHQIVVEAMDALDRTALRYADQPYSLKNPAAAARAVEQAGLAAPRYVDSRSERRRRAVAAVTAYTTQIGFQFGGADRLRAALDGAFIDGTPLWPATPELPEALLAFLLST